MDSNKSFVAKLAVVAIILTSTLAWVPSRSGAATYMLGNRIVPGPLPPQFTTVLPQLDVRLNIQYGPGSNPWQRLDYAKPRLCASQKVPLIMYVHGGWWVGGSKAGGLYSWTARLAYQLGFAFVSVEYRLASSTNHHPNLINDCKLAVRYMRAHADQFGIDPDKIGVWGSSAGGHLVSLMGTAGDDDGLEGPGYEGFSSRPESVVNFCGIEDLTRPWSSTATFFFTIFLGCSPTLCPTLAEQASPVHQASPDDPPILILHGDHDNVVEYTQAQYFGQALKNADNKGAFIRIVNGNHGFGAYAPGVVVHPNWTRIYWLTIAHLARHIEPALLCDLNMDGKVDSVDANELWSHLGKSGFAEDGGPGPESWNPLSDILLDGKIDYKDIQSFCGQIAKPVTIEKTVVPPTGKNSKTFQFQIKISNNGPLVINDLMLTDMFPKELVFISSSPPAVLQGGSVVANLDRLDGGHSATFTFFFKLTEGTVVPDAGLVLGNFAKLESPDIFAIDDSTTFGLPGIKVKKTSKSFQVSEGQLATFTIVASNPSPYPLTGVVVQDNFPKELAFVSSQPQGVVAGPSVKFEVGALGPGESRHFELTFRLNKVSIAEKGLTITNSASAFSNERYPVFDSASLFSPKKERGGAIDVKIGWNGIDIKNSTVAAGQSFEIIILADGGNPPYDVTIDFGDGERVTKSIFSSVEQKVIKHAYKSSGSYNLIINCMDSNARSQIIRKVIIVK